MRPTVVAPQAAGTVWVNTRSHIYHYQGQRWYGHTIQGKYMKEADAIAEGDRATQNGQQSSARLRDAISLGTIFDLILSPLDGFR